jgi:hypothetical protein
MAYDEAYVAKPNTGSLFKNSFKKTETQPDLRGEIVLDKTFLLDLIDKSKDPTIKVSISAWSKESEKVGKYLSLSIGQPYVKKTESNPWE